MQNAAKTYFQTQFTTMGQDEVLLLLYDGALKFLAQAKEEILVKNYEAKGIAIARALDIIAELDATLNPEAGGDLVDNLHQLYFICSTRLLTANLKMDTQLIDNVMAVLAGLRSAYAEIQNRPEAQAAARQIADKQRAFDIKGQANRPVEVSSTHNAGVGGAKAHAAYDMAARQVQPVAVPLPETQAAPEAPAIVPQAAPLGANRAASLSAYGRAAQHTPS